LGQVKAVALAPWSELGVATEHCHGRASTRGGREEGGAVAAAGARTMRRAGSRMTAREGAKKEGHWEGEGGEGVHDRLCRSTRPIAR